MLITTAPAPSQRSTPSSILGEGSLLRWGTLEGSSLSKMRVSEVDPLLKKRAPIELIVNPTISSATVEGIDLTFTPNKRFTEFKVECVSKLLMLAGSQRMVTFGSSAGCRAPNLEVD
jgi:hypothetical protein